MKDLVFVENGQVLTDSLTIAEAFDKEHKRVLQDIRTLECSDSFREHNFVPSSYVNLQNKDMPMVLMNKKGFTLLAMSYTGKQAMEFKEAYIEKFEEMEKSLTQPKLLSEKEQLMAAMKLSLTNATEVEEVKKEVTEIRSMVENQITLDHGEQRRLQIAVSTKVYELESNPRLRPKLFQELYREIKNRFGVASYKDVKRQELQTAIKYVDAWLPRKVS